MPKPTEFVKVIFSAFYTSGEIVTRKSKAQTFARKLRENHVAFVKSMEWNGKWHGQEIAVDQRNLTITFETILKLYDKKNKCYKDLESTQQKCNFEL